MHDKHAAAQAQHLQTASQKGVGSINTSYTALNQLLTETFNEILKLEERSIRLATENALSLTEVHTLEAIGCGVGKSMTEVAARLKITVSTLTISVNRLVNKGYVGRFRTAEDRRVVKVHLTPEGIAIVKAHDSFHERMIETVAKTLSDDELRIFNSCIENLLAFFCSEDALVTRKLSEQENNRPALPPDDIIGVENIEEISVD